VLDQLIEMTKCARWAARPAACPTKAHIACAHYIVDRPFTEPDYMITPGIGRGCRLLHFPNRSAQVL